MWRIRILPASGSEEIKETCEQADVIVPDEDQASTLDQHSLSNDVQDAEVSEEPVDENDVREDLLVNTGEESELESSMYGPN